MQTIQSLLLEIQNLRNNVGLPLEKVVSKTPQLKLNPQAKKALFAGTDDQNKTTARDDFLHYLQTRIKQGKPKQSTCSLAKRKSDPAAATISISELLDKEGVKKYGLAIEEESKSRVYMEKLLRVSTKFRPGSKFTKRPILVVSGPSSSGKSRADKVAEDLMARNFPTNPHDLSGNHIIKVDGGDAREQSDIQKIVIEAALARGYSGVHDLQSHSKVLGKAKERLLNAALLEDQAAVNIPETFSNWFTIQSFMSRLQNVPNVRVFYTRVEGQDPDIFRNVVKRLGVARAYQGDPNSKKLPESKDYEPRYFLAGREGSKFAESFFSYLNPYSRSYIIENDLIQVRKTKTSWEPFEGEKNSGAEVMLISKRVFEKWKGGNYLNEPRKVKPAGEEEKPDDIIYVKYNEAFNYHEEVADDHRSTNIRVRRDFWDAYCKKREQLKVDDQTMSKNSASTRKSLKLTRQTVNLSLQRPRDNLHISLEEFNGLYQDLPPRIYEASWHRVKTAVFTFTKLQRQAKKISKIESDLAVDIHTLMDAFEAKFVDADETRDKYFEERKDAIQKITRLIEQNKNNFSDKYRDALKKIVEALNYHEKRIKLTAGLVDGITPQEMEEYKRFVSQDMDEQIKAFNDSELQSNATFLQKHPNVHKSLTGIGMALIAVGFVVGIVAIVIVTQGMALAALCAIIASFSALMFSTILSFSVFMEKAKMQTETSQPMKNVLEDWQAKDIDHCIDKMAGLQALALSQENDVVPEQVNTKDLSDDDFVTAEGFVSDSDAEDELFQSRSYDESKELSQSTSSKEIVSSDNSSGSPLLNNSFLSQRCRGKAPPTVDPINNIRPNTI